MSGENSAGARRGQSQKIRGRRSKVRGRRVVGRGCIPGGVQTGKNSPPPAQGRPTPDPEAKKRSKVLRRGESRLVCGGRQLGSAVAGGGDLGGSEKAVGGFVGRGFIPGGIRAGAGIGNPFSHGDTEGTENVPPGSVPGCGFINYRTDPFSDPFSPFTDPFSSVLIRGQRRCGEKVTSWR